MTREQFLDRWSSALDRVFGSRPLPPVQLPTQPVIGGPMTNDQLLQGIWEAVYALGPVLTKHGTAGVVRSYAVGASDGAPMEVATARAAFEASVLETVQVYLESIAQPIRPADGPISEPVFDAEPMTPAADERRADLLRWLRESFPWAELKSDDSYTALRASSLLRNTVDAIRAYGGAAEVAEVLRANGLDPRQVT